MKKILQIISYGSIFLLVLSFTSRAGEIKYPVSQVPANLKTNAKAVIRYEEKVLDIESIREATIHHRYVITILNENSLRDAVFIEPYDKFTRIHDIRGTIYNEAGEKVEQLTQDKIIDHSAISQFSLFEDYRVRYFEPRYRKVPFTVEYSYDVKMDGILQFPAWLPITDYNKSVEKSIFKVTAPNNTYFKYFSRNTELEPVIETTPGRISYSWTIGNQAACETEPFSVSFPADLPAVYFAPNNFSIEDYSGNMSSWTEFGKWILQMNINRDQLPDETRESIKILIRDCTTDLQKAQKIYEFFQKKTRYVSVQIGIGGWQPIAAETVDRLGYGDCKALSNYLKSLLSVAGINAYYTLVLAGDDAPPPLKEFPSQQFNHAMLCLPLKSDTIWLECTDQSIPFGFIGRFTDDRTVLVVNEHGGQIAHTRKYSADENRMDSHVFVTIDGNGNAQIKRRAIYRGLFFENNFSLFLADAGRQKKLIYDKINIPGIVLNSFQYKENPGFVPSIEESLDFYAPKYSSLVGDRILVKFNGLEPYKVPGRLPERKFNVTIRRDYYSVDTITVQIPEGFMIESIPSDALVKSLFGQCEYAFIKNADNSVDCIRKVSFNSGTSSPKTYVDLLDFYNKINSGNNLKMCLKKKPV